METNEDDLILRVQSAIDSSEMSRSEFARAIGIDAPKLSKSLSGSRRFTSLELAMVAEVSGCTVDWLLTGQVARSLQFARRAVRGSENEADQVGATVVEKLQSRFETLEAVEMPMDVPTLPDAGTAWSYVYNANVLASKVRALLNVEQIALLELEPLIERIERGLGIQVVVTELPDGCDGLSYSHGDFRAIVLATTDVPFRQRYTLAHEIAHIAFGDAENGLIEERLWTEKSTEESRANAFAAAFLAPEDELRIFIGDRTAVEAFDDLVLRFQISPSSMAWRLLNENLIEKSDVRKLAAENTRTIAMRRGQAARVAELSQASGTERPAWSLVAALLQAYRAGEITVKPVAATLGWSIEYAHAFFDGIGDEGPADLSYLEN